MKEIHGFFDDLFFPECVLGKARIEEGTLKIPVSGLFVLGGHPLANERPGPFEGELEFNGVAESRRTLREYIGDPCRPDGFKALREEVDLKRQIGSNLTGLHEFEIEGYQESPSAWISNWYIYAKSFKLRVG
ncbi:hypothetical protein GNX71_01240 [Variovorax sp. RKNM96]|uniref:hypothetical protein n=1 Tax=Variovorax sp. RKNM96 TaxID=2681552 RepID=UPI0019814193|nr:hypothetical protein [Variovorax sp. RKNM96]QSI28273.1 hypothetical protein GNX71_01240 [Variovorax sp. RKNM96]